MSELLPAVPVPQGGYLPAVSHGRLVVSAGMTPRVAGRLLHVGRVGRDVDIEEAKESAAAAAGNAVAAVVDAVGSVDSVTCLRLTVYVNAASDFTDHTQVADAASERIEAILGERGRSARSAVGVASLPGGAPVEVELMCAVAGQAGRCHPAASALAPSRCP